MNFSTQRLAFAADGMHGLQPSDGDLELSDCEGALSDGSVALSDRDWEPSDGEGDTVRRLRRTVRR